jgi:ankyrin repeat protein
MSLGFRNQTALHYGAKNGHFDIVESLLGDRKVNTMAIDIDGNTCLHLSAMKGYVHIVNQDRLINLDEDNILARRRDIDIASYGH